MTKDQTSWIKCSDRLPNNGEPVFMHYQYVTKWGTREFGNVAVFSPESGWKSEGIDLLALDADVTHWMPMPELQDD